VIAQTDPELLPWLLGIENGKPTSAGGFLTALAGAALRADSQNYGDLRPALLKIRDRFPKYHDDCAAGAFFGLGLRKRV
jgi:hypothetical protein